MKSKMKISKIIILILMLTFVSLATSGCGTQTKLPSLKLPEFGGFTPRNFEIQLNADVSKLPKYAVVYKIAPQKINRQTVEKLCKIFGVSSSAISIKKDGFVEKKQNGKELYIYTNTGFYEFSTQSMYHYSPGKIVPPKEECIKIAKSFAEKYNLLPKMYSYHIDVNYITFNPSFNKSIVTDRIVTFKPVVNGREILGPKFGITIGNEGEIEGVSNHLYNITLLKGKYALKSIDKVITELKSNKSQQWWIKPDEPDVEKIIVNKVEMEYYGDIGTSEKLGQPFVQPVYYLSGEVVFKNSKKGEFGVTIPAVDNRYIIGN